MGSTSGDFTVRSAWEDIRKKKSKAECYTNIWNKGLPLKISFFLWRVWKGRIPIDDKITVMGIQNVSRCRCCEIHEQETMTHLLLNSTIAKKLWKYFASSAGINIEGLNLKQVIYRWWNETANPS